MPKKVLKKVRKRTWTEKVLKKSSVFQIKRNTAKKSAQKKFTKPYKTFFEDWEISQKVSCYHGSLLLDCASAHCFNTVLLQPQKSDHSIPKLMKFAWIDRGKEIPILGKVHMKEKKKKNRREKISLGQTPNHPPCRTVFLSFFDSRFTKSANTYICRKKRKRN